MPKGKTEITRVVLTKNEFNELVLAERIYPFDRVTLNNLDRFKMKHEDLRTIPNVDLVILSAS